MPTYDYVCRACGHRVEVMHGVHEHGPTECPNCHARAMRKAIVSPTVLYKGSGWAKKDRGATARTKAAAKADGTESSAKAPAEAGASGAKATAEPSSGAGAEPGSGAGSDAAAGSGSRSGSSRGDATGASGAKGD
jgi:putative FmdB family regulatory protein